MGGRRFPLLAAAIVLASGSVHGPAWGQRACVFTENDCPDQDLTTRTVQLGGAGSLSSNGSAFGNPGRLDDGTIAEADLEFSFDRSTGRLTLVARNQTASTASLTGVGLNTAPGVTGMTLLSHDGNLPWELAFDADRLDGVVDTHPSLPELKMDGFGRLNAFLGNSGIDTGETGGGRGRGPGGGGSDLPDPDLRGSGRHHRLLLRRYRDLDPARREDRDIRREVPGRGARRNGLHHAVRTRRFAGGTGRLRG